MVADTLTSVILHRSGYCLRGGIFFAQAFNEPSLPHKESE